MSRSLYVNLPVADLPRSIAFFTALGFSFDPKFTSEDATCLVIAEHIRVMLLSRSFFGGFTPKPVADARATTEVLLALSCEQRDEVAALVARAVAAGASTPVPPRDLGYMVQHGFEDPDGHQWEVFWMDEAAYAAASV